MRNLSTEFKEQQNSGNRNYLKYADLPLQTEAHYLSPMRTYGLMVLNLRMQYRKVVLLISAQLS